MYKGLDRGRFQQLLSEALASNDLHSFFMRNRARLIQAHAKVENLPPDRATALQTLVRMPERAFHVWQQSYIGEYEKGSLKTALEVATEYKEYLDADEPPEPDTIRALARAALYHLLLDDCPIELTSLFKQSLANGLPQLAAPSSDVQNLAPKDGSFSDANLAELRELANHIVGIVQIAPEGLQKDSLAFVSALAALRKKNVRLAKQLQQTISESNPRYALIEDAIDHVLVEFENVARKSKGLVLAEPITRNDSETFNPEECEFLGHCNRSSIGRDNNPSFIEVIGVWAGEQLFTYPDGVVKDCLPQAGELIAYEKAPQGRPWLNEVGVWTVELIPNITSGMNIHYRLKRRSQDVYEIIDIPFARDDYDSVREWIREFHPSTHMRTIFRTSDGLLIKPKRDTHDFSNDNFEEPMQAWRKLRAVEWNKRRFAIGKLPTHDFLFDCSDIDRMLPALMRSAVQTSAIPFSRQNVAALVDAITTLRSQIDPNRGRVIGRNLQLHLDNLVNLQSVIDEVLKHPSVIAAIDAEKKRVAEDVFNARTDLIADVARLKEEISGLERTARQKKTELAQLPQLVSKQIKVAFDKAVQDGVNTLSQVGLLSAFVHLEPNASNISAANVVQSNAQAQVVAAGYRPQNTYVTNGDVNLAEILNSSGIAKPRAKIMLSAVEIALDAGLVVVFAGVAAPTIARRAAMARTKSQGLVTNIKVGISEQIFSEVELCDPGRLWDLVLLQNFNHAPQETYGHDLFESVVDQMLGVRAGPPLQVLATYSSGLSGLPISPSVRNVCFILDLDNIPLSVGVDNIDDWEQALLDESEDDTRPRPWSVVVKRLAETVRRSAIEAKPDLINLLEAGISTEPLQEE